MTTSEGPGSRRNCFDQNLCKVAPEILKRRKTFGSLIQLAVMNEAWPLCAMPSKPKGPRRPSSSCARRTQSPARARPQAEALTQRYHVVVPNPPLYGVRKGFEFQRENVSLKGRK